MGNGTDLALEGAGQAPPLHNQDGDISPLYNQVADRVHSWSFGDSREAKVGRRGPIWAVVVAARRLAEVEGGRTSMREFR